MCYNRFGDYMKIKKLIRYISIFIFAAVFVFSGYKILIYFKTQKEAVDLYKNYEVKNSVSIPEKTKEPDIEIDFNSLKKENDDIVGWIYSPDTVINYPVLQGENNNEYLYHLPNGKYNIAGSIFADYRNSEFGSDSNYIIYGHHMKNDSMFGTIYEYRSEEYYKKHPVIYYLTPEKSYKLELYSSFVAKADSSVFEINKTREDMDKYMKDIAKKSRFKSNTEYISGDKIVTLSTCTNISDDERFVLIGIIKEII